MASIPAIGSVSIAPGNASSLSRDISQLRRQVGVLTDKARRVLSSDADAETKQRQVEAIRAQIRALEAQIARLQRLQSERNRQAASEPVSAPDLRVRTTAPTVDLEA